MIANRRVRVRVHVRARERRYALLVALLLWAGGCVDDEDVPRNSPGFNYRTGEVPVVTPIEPEVFLRDTVAGPGPGHVVLHLSVPGDASREQIRQALVQLLSAEGERDASLVALRGIVYVSRPTSEPTAEMVPIAWAEWVGPDGWPARTRREPYRVYTYFEGPPW